MEAENPFVVVDSWEVLTEGMETMEKAKAFKVLESLLTSKNANIVFVSETTDVTPLDCQADGIAVLALGNVGGRILRTLEHRKLRGMGLDQLNHLFSLAKGRCNHLPRFTFKGIGEGPKWRHIPDSETHFSTGNRALDKLLGGGYPRGGTVLLDVGPDVPRNGYSTVVIILSANFLSQERGVIGILSENWDLGQARSLVSSLAGEQAFDRQVRILVESKPSEEKPYIVRLSGEDIVSDFEAWQGVCDTLRGRLGSPFSPQPP